MRLLTRPELLILDEPTSVLTPQAVEKLFVVLRSSPARAAAFSTSATSCTKFANSAPLAPCCAGQGHGRVQPAEESNAPVAPDDWRRAAHAAACRAPGEVVLRVQGLRLAREDQFGVDLDDVQLQVRAGEVVGIAGVSGNGQRNCSMPCRARTTAPPRAAFAGRRGWSHLHPGRRRKLGLHFVPEERLGRGAVPTLSLAHNLLLTRNAALAPPAGWVRLVAGAGHAHHDCAVWRVKGRGPMARKVAVGGNLQKFIVGREIDARPKLLIVSQPTWGVDVGALRADPRRNPAPARCGLRGAGSVRSWTSCSTSATGCS